MTRMRSAIAPRPVRLPTMHTIARRGTVIQCQQSNGPNRYLVRPADREKRRRNRCGVPWYTTLLPVSGLYCTNIWGVEEHFRILVPRDLKGPGPTVDKAKAEGKGRSVRAVARARRDRPVRWTPGMLTRTYSRPLCGRRGVRRHLFSETGTYILSTHYTHSHTSSRST